MDETISLRELIETIWRGKWIIASTTIVALMLSALASFVWIKPTYSANATVSVNNGIVPGKQFDETDSYFNEIITPSAYMERVQSLSVIEEGIKNAHLQGKYMAEQVKGSLSVENVPNTNLVRVTLKAANPSDTKKLLDGILNAVNQSIWKDIQTGVEKDLHHFMKLKQKEHVQLQQTIKRYRQEAASLKLPPSLLLDAVISYNNQYIMTLDSDHLRNISSLSEKELIALNELSNQIKSLADRYRQYVNKEQQLRDFIQTFSIGNKILTISAPVVPQAPDSPKPLLNMAIAFVAGAMIGTGMVFFRRYWEESGR
ncbi:MULTISPECIES: YveK family protein [Geobacillus]|uniref:YveK family protein n=1 Tax=Geobacillus TaxID=129337 RepID=UPI0030F5EECF